MHHTRERMPDDWIGPFCPFYPRNTPQSNIIDSLLMKGENGGKIVPFGKIYGVTYYDLETTNTTYNLELIPVGQKDSNILIPKSK